MLNILLIFLLLSPTHSLSLSLSLTLSQATMEHRKLAVDLAEVVIKWELQRTKEDQEQTTEVGPWKTTEVGPWTINASARKQCDFL